VIKTSKNLGLDSRIVRLTEDLNSLHSRSLEQGTSLKDKIDETERRIGGKQKDKELEKSRDQNIEHLDELVDTLVLTSGKLDDLRESCKRFQDLTTSLLCYSLSRFRENKKTNKEG
jgi:hypothetical protein